MNLRVSVSLCETMQAIVTYPLLSCGTNITRYVWGLDISGQSGGRASSQAEMQGAGGVGGLCAVFPDNGITPHYPAYDANGNITEYVDFIGNTIAHYEYDAFGNTVNKSGSMADDFVFRFSTKDLDAETGLYGYGERYYNPVLGRFISRDPIEEQGGLNLYGFCGNDPINKWDYLGMSAYWDNYPNYDSHQTTAVWQMVGGNLLWQHLIDEKKENYYNSCALRVSISLNKSGKTIGGNEGANRNYNTKKVDKDVNNYGVQIRKGEILKALPDENQRYFIRANQLSAFLDKSFPDVEKLSWKNKEDAQKHKNCIEKNDAEAYFVAPGHAGMIKKGYTDPYYQNYDTGQIWVITGSCYGGTR